MKKVVKSNMENIYTTFANTAVSLGYSEVHGRILAVLLASGKTLSLREVARRTGYSLSMISLSLDLLELVGMIKRVKRKGDRKLYVALDGDILEGLRKAIFLKIQKNICDTLNDFEKYKGSDKEINKAITRLEKEIKRLEIYIKKLSEVKLP